MAGDVVAGRLRAGLVAFAAGDALGAPYAGRVPKEIPRAKHLEPGPTTGATAQLLAACEVLCEGLDDVGRRFVERVAAAPEVSATDNGPLLRAIAVGWAVPGTARRRSVALELGLATHGHSAAWASVLVAELAAMSLDGRPIRHAVDDVADGWALPRRGVPSGARETLEALFALVYRHADPDKGLKAAVKLGGATDVLAALAGAILGVGDPRAVDRLPWLDAVALPPGIDELAARLTAVRGT